MIKFPEAASLIDERALNAEMAAIFQRATLSGADPRPELLAALKRANQEGRAAARDRLRNDRDGVGCARRLSALVDLLIRVIHHHTITRVFPGCDDRIAVVAVGGYGRATLAPSSDVDLLFLLPPKPQPLADKVLEHILYFLWDIGFKVGHSTRRVEDCIRLGRADMTIRTALLEARFILGDRDLYAEMVSRFNAEVVRGTGPEFIQAKLAERDERHRRAGTSRYLVEPNVKDGKGGLRDLHTLFWIAKYFYRAFSADELVKHGVFSQKELQRFHKCEEFLWAVRCNLHFVTNRADDRLGFENQREIAELLGYQEHPGLEPVERFMKHYFLVAKDVGDLTRIFCAALEEMHAKPKPMLDRVLHHTFRRRKKSLPGTPQFIIDNDRLSVTDERVFERDPVNLLRIFAVADRTGLDFHPDALKLITRSLRLIDADLRDNEEANRIFLDVLSSKKHAETVLRAMNETGVLGRFIHEFGRVVAMMQFNMYHHYTVDEHTLRAIGLLTQIERGEDQNDHPLATELFPTIANRKLLYLALFLHDIAKGRVEDHSTAGAKIARRLGPRFGFSPGETDQLAWLVENHLVMSMIAQSRDLSDRQTIRDFAAVVQTVEKLRMLLLLTVADIKAVGPGVWNGWKGQLLRTLFYETEPYLLGGHSKLSRDQRVAAAKAELAAELTDWSEAELADYGGRHFAPYWLRVDLPEKVMHARLLKSMQGTGRRLATTWSTKKFEAITELVVVAPDHPRLLSTITGACAAAGVNIADAQIYTTTDGLALDTILINREFPEDADEFRRADRVLKMIEAALEGRERLPEIVARRVGQRKPSKAFSVPTEIRFDNTLSASLSVLEVSCLDRPGLLYDVTTAMSDLNLNIASAHIATFGERAVDVFYVTDLTKLKIQSGAKQAAIRRRILAAVDGEDVHPPKKAAGE
ncbi:[protein-PII] uridylyltransferase [Pleomorphomonas koreensis]|uniref:[protein-PII] uridylyltransferase n=1 Tax=Pleomorphomonas koreensis TaxID=257440 RepID=UPI000421CFEE|nr:[protein-PII] uridylyltransferase [Pleomorphomonas koreensis]